MIMEIYLAAFLIVLTAFAGKMLTWGTLGNWVKKHMRFLTTFALGVFSVMLLFVYQETTEFSLSFGKVLLFAFFGILFLELVQRLIPDGHHHHGDNRDECHHIRKINPKRVLMSDFFHNMSDGIALASTFLVSNTLGWSLALGIFVHEFVQETSEFFILREAGYSIKKALWSNFFVQLSIFLGIFLTLFFQGEKYIPYLMSIALGMLAFVVFRDLFPHSFHIAREKKEYGKHIFVWILGVGVMLLVRLIFGEA